MADSSISTLRSGVGGGSGQGKPSRARRLALWLAAIGALAVIAVVAAAVIPGSHATTTRFSQLVVAPHGSGANQLTARQTKIFGSKIAASRYGTQISQRENGIGPNGQIASDLDPLPPSTFKRPVAGYIHYALGVSGRLGNAVSALTAQLRAGDRGAAERAWDVAFTDYLHLGAVYGLLPGNLNDRLAQVPSDLTQTHFTGLHRSRRACGRARHSARWSRCQRRSVAPWSASSARCPGPRSIRWTTPPARTRSSRTPSAT